MEGKKQLNIKLEKELYEILQSYAQTNFKSITAVIKDFIVNLKTQKTQKKEKM